MTRFLRSFICLFVVRSLLLSACGPAMAPEPIAEVQTQVAQGALTKPPGSDSVQIHGADATFPLPIYSEWTYAYSYVDPTVEISYEEIGSEDGKKAVITGAIDFAGSDSLLKVAEYQAGKDLQMYLVLAGAVVNFYNFKPARDYSADFEAPALIPDRQTLVQSRGSIGLCRFAWCSPQPGSDRARGGDL